MSNITSTENGRLCFAEKKRKTMSRCAEVTVVCSRTHRFRTNTQTNPAWASILFRSTALYVRCVSCTVLQRGSILERPGMRLLLEDRNIYQVYVCRRRRAHIGGECGTAASSS